MSYEGGGGGAGCSNEVGVGPDVVCTLTRWGGTGCGQDIVCTLTKLF